MSFTDPYSEPDESSRILHSYFFKNQFNLSSRLRLHIPFGLVRCLPDQNFVCSFHVLISCCTFLTPHCFLLIRDQLKSPSFTQLFKENCSENSSFFHLISHIFNKIVFILAITCVLGWNFTQRIGKWNTSAFFLTYRIWCCAWMTTKYSWSPCYITHCYYCLLQQYLMVKVIVSTRNWSRYEEKRVRILKQ